MATLAEPFRAPARDDTRFFLTMAIVMALTIVAGFSFQLAMGRSSFRVPLYLHAHALIFFGWTTLYVVQNALAASGSIALHRRLGWLGLAWMTAMPVIGIYATVRMVQRGGAPFFFQPTYFLVMNILSVLVFFGLGVAAILLRRRTEWHRRLHYCGMTVLTGPAFGRLLPMPLLIPWAGWGVFAAMLIFPVIGIAADLRRSGKVHPAWWWGLGALVTTHLAISLIGEGSLGVALYEVVVAGTPGASVPPLAYPPFPPLS